MVDIKFIQILSYFSLCLSSLHQLLNQKQKPNQQTKPPHNNIRNRQKLVLRPKKIRLRNNKIFLSSKPTYIITYTIK